MKLYLKQKIFTWGDKFSVYDENGTPRYQVEGEVFTFGKKLHLCDTLGNELAFIHQKLFSFLPRYYISRGGRDVAEVVKEFTFFKQEYSVEGLGWQVHGDFWDHTYEVTGGGRTIASVSKHWFTWGDTYEIDIADGLDEVMALAVVLVIDACIEAANNND
jgi:uncharacterized protein YxjI